MGKKTAGTDIPDRLGVLLLRSWSNELGVVSSCSLAGGPEPARWIKTVPAKKQNLDVVQLETDGPFCGP